MRSSVSSSTTFPMVGLQGSGALMQSANNCSCDNPSLSIVPVMSRKLQLPRSLPVFQYR